MCCVCDHDVGIGVPPIYFICMYIMSTAPRPRYVVKVRPDPGMSLNCVPTLGMSLNNALG